MKSSRPIYKVNADISFRKERASFNNSPELNPTGVLNHQFEIDATAFDAFVQSSFVTNRARRNSDSELLSRIPSRTQKLDSEDDSPRDRTPSGDSPKESSSGNSTPPAEPSRKTSVARDSSSEDESTLEEIKPSALKTENTSKDILQCLAKIVAKINPVKTTGKDDVRIERFSVDSLKDKDNNEKKLLYLTLRINKKQYRLITISEEDFFGTNQDGGASITTEKFASPSPNKANTFFTEIYALKDNKAVKFNIVPAQTPVKTPAKEIHEAILVLPELTAKVQKEQNNAIQKLIHEIHKPSEKLLSEVLTDFSAQDPYKRAFLLNKKDDTYHISLSSAPDLLEMDTLIAVKTHIAHLKNELADLRTGSKKIEDDFFLSIKNEMQSQDALSVYERVFSGKMGHLKGCIKDLEDAIDIDDLYDMDDIDLAVEDRKKALETNSRLALERSLEAASSEEEKRELIEKSYKVPQCIKTSLAEYRKELIDIKLSGNLSNSSSVIANYQTKNYLEHLKKEAEALAKKIKDKAVSLRNNLPKLPSLREECAASKSKPSLPSNIVIEEQAKLLSEISEIKAPEQQEDKKPEAVAEPANNKVTLKKENEPLLPKSAEGIEEDRTNLKSRFELTKSPEEIERARTNLKHLFTLCSGEYLEYWGKQTPMGGEKLTLDNGKKIKVPKTIKHLWDLKIDVASIDTMSHEKLVELYADKVFTVFNDARKREKSGMHAFFNCCFRKESTSRLIGQMGFLSLTLFSYSKTLEPLMTQINQEMTNSKKGPTP